MPGLRRHILRGNMSTQKRPKLEKTTDIKSPMGRPMTCLTDPSQAWKGTCYDQENHTGPQRAYSKLESICFVAEVPIQHFEAPAGSENHVFCQAQRFLAVMLPSFAELTDRLGGFVFERALDPFLRWSVLKHKL